MSTTRSISATTLELASEPQAIESALRVCRAFLEPEGVEARSRVEVVLRELLSNAVIHGNQNDPAKRVKCVIEMCGETCMRITVEDEGQGFDYAAIDLSIPHDPQRSRQRGFALVNALADRLDFNDKGNQVTAYVTYRKENGIHGK